MSYNFDLVTMVLLMVFSIQYIVPKINSSKNWLSLYAALIVVFGVRGFVFSPFEMSDAEKFIRGCSNGLAAIALGAIVEWFKKKGNTPK